MPHPVRSSGGPWRLLASVTSIACLAIHAPAMHGQEIVFVPESLTCGACRIVAVNSGTLGQDVRLPGHLLNAVRLTDGRIVASFASSSFAPIIFDSAGNTVSTLQPRSDADRYRNLTTVFACEFGGVCVHDSRRRRIHLFDGQLAPIRAIDAPMDLSTNIVQLTDGRFVAAGVWATRDMAGFPLHLFEADGTAAFSFGVNRPYFVASEAPELRRVLGSRVGGGFWSANRTAPLIEEWNNTPRMVRQLYRNVPWFTPYTRPRPFGPDSMPSPAIAAIRQDSAGLVWLLTLRAVTDWRSATQFDVRDLGDRTMTTPVEIHRLYETVVEVIDPLAGAILARTTVPASLISMLEGSRALGLSVDADGRPRVSVWRLALTRDGR